uniref:Uncharacterized protein n=1 Tax=Branchiostoma floridae TaxID=7739 RepID=C3Y9D8_BRAFL|eukprot:XP_002607184.1 hypothetical protein BRAFLDRAFT_118638 [Branchiostoma floridae]
MAGNVTQFPGLDRFCGSTFWDHNLLESVDPDLTPCFQKTVLVWIPCFFLWAVAPLYYLYLRRHNRGYIQMSKMNKAKTSLAALLVLVTLLDLCYSLWEYTNGVNVPAVNFVAPLILAMSMGLAGFFIQYERLKGRQSSVVLFLFWLLATLCGIVTFRSNIRVALLQGNVSDTFRFVTFYLYFPLVLTQLILSAFSERAPLFSEASRDPNPCPEESSSYLSKITFWWFNPLVILGYKRALERADLYSLNHVDRSDHVVPVFEKEWQKERQKCQKFDSQDAKVVYQNLNGVGKVGYELLPNKGEVEIVDGSENAKKCNPSLVKALVRCFWHRFAVIALYKLIQDILLFVSPQLLRLLISFTKVKEVFSWKGYLYAVLLWVVAILQSLVLGQYFHGSFLMGMRLRTVIISAVYKKSVVLTNEARKSSTVGEIINLMSVDAQRFMDLCSHINMLWSAPFQIAVSLYFLWQTLGASILAGLGVMILLIPVNAILGNIIKKLQVKQMKHKDTRMKLMNEVLNGIKVLKLYAWELSFREKIEKIRSKELQILRNIAFVNALTTFTWVCAPVLVSLTTFAVYVMVDEKNILDAEKAFVALALFNIIRCPLSTLPNLITNLVQGSTAYVPQQAWIQNATLRDNILFGKHMKCCQYKEVLEACALEQDLGMLPAGDLTEIGEKGINLSGGQKQRVSLARAVYSDSNIYYLDDPLSAVDAHVGKHIFDHVIGPNGILKGKCDQIMVLVDGRIWLLGTYTELMEQNEAFAEFIRNYGNVDENKKADPTDKGSQRILRKGSPDSHIGKLDGIAKAIPLKGIFCHDQKCLPQKEETTERDKLIQKEIAETGRVKSSVFVEYLRSVGITLSVIVCLLYCAQNAASIYSNIWLSVCVVVTAFLSAYGGIRSSLHLHNKSLLNILRSPMQFFDVTPMGRIINRFSQDMNIVDNVIPRIIRMWLYRVFGVLNALIVISFSTPVFLATILPLALPYYFIQRFYLATSRQLKRIESISRSPIYSHFGETVQGTSTIRAYGRHRQFFFQNQAKVDENHMAYYPTIVSNRWLALRLEFLGNCIVLFAGLFAVIGRENLSPGIVGLSITYALQITQTLAWVVRQTSEVETKIVAVERIKEYTETPTEADWVVDDNRPPDNWPSEGKVNFNSYQTRYREGLDLVIKGINVNIKGGEKIGVVGRTGAGKSSMTLGLFRIIEAAGGDIEIDGVNISKIGLHDLRGRITIIPQVVQWMHDPVLFSGTLRMNLDPFDSCSDRDIWVALELSHLKDFVMGLGAQLEYEVSEGGENLSVGQRQLVCLARALLRKSKILVLDEATAAVDLETDDLIQSTIRTQFADCTVLTIAHRLNTIMDSTRLHHPILTFITSYKINCLPFRVLVLDAGRIAEFDSPQDLIASRGIFYRMAKDAGLAI